MDDFMFQDIPGLLGRLYAPEAELDRRESVPFPPVNLIEDGEALYVRALMPGVALDSVSLNCREKKLLIAGVAPLTEGTYFRQERFSGSFRREVALPFPVRAGEARAHMIHGVLEIVIPKMNRGS